EARARLANTQGKKAKWKAREEQLKEAHRLAAVQKLRELRAAGIELAPREKKKRGLDHNAEIPFEKLPQPGFHDTSNEIFDQAAPDFSRLRLQHLDGELRTEKEERERRKDKQKLKQWKENDIPMVVLQNQEPAKKRRKLVLPEPRISDQELQQVVKLGRASEAAREVSTEGGHQPSDTLLADYSLTPAGDTQTPRTPALTTDRILQEAHNMMALTRVDTPLKGGLNTHLQSSNFSGMTPQREIVTTPNTVHTTPFRSQHSDALHAPAGGGFHTPNLDGNSGAVAPTPICDKLSINREEGAVVGHTPQTMHIYQRQLKEQLLSGLNSLPAPRNDYEIVVPDSEEEIKAPVDTVNSVEDQADVDTRYLAELKAKCELEMQSRSQPVQRDLPRPVEVNMAVLCPPHTDTPLTELQKADELIKTEMITMLHYDAVYSPPIIPAETKKRGQVRSQAQHLVYLEQHPYETYSQDQLAQANTVLQQEMKVVKQGMGHEDLSLESYTQVWEECLARILFLTSQNR
ncbi:Cell division cycle 5-like protein, partial [Cryptotermes secundus]